MFNHGAVGSNYAPKSQAEEFFVVVNIGTGVARVVPDPALNAVARQSGGARLPSAG